MSRMIQIAKNEYINKNDISRVEFRIDADGKHKIFVQLRTVYRVDPDGCYYYDIISIYRDGNDEPITYAKFVAFLNELNECHPA